MTIGAISSISASQVRPTPPTEPPAKVAAALIAASRGSAGVDIARLAAGIAALEPRDPATADISVRLKDGTTVVADRDGSSADGKTLSALRDSADRRSVRSSAR